MSQNIHALVKLVKSKVSCLLLYVKKTGSGLENETQHNLRVSVVWFLFTLSR